MEPDNREELGALFAGLLGVLIGLSLRRARSTRGAQPAMAVGTSTLIATPALGRMVGDLLHLDRSNRRAHAAISFVVGAMLAFFADEIARYLPSGRGLPVRKG